MLQVRMLEVGHHPSNDGICALEDLRMKGEQIDSGGSTFV